MRQRDFSVYEEPDDDAIADMRRYHEAQRAIERRHEDEVRAANDRSVAELRAKEAHDKRVKEAQYGDFWNRLTPLT